MTETSHHPRKPSLLCFFFVDAWSRFLVPGRTAFLPPPLRRLRLPSSASSVRSSSFAPFFARATTTTRSGAGGDEDDVHNHDDGTTHVLQRLLLDARAEELDLAHLKR